MPRSTMGRLLPPVDITSESQLSELDKRIDSRLKTLFAVLAEWCGHCQRLKPILEEVEKDPNRSIQIVKIRDTVFPKSRYASEKIEGYPTLMLIDEQGSVVKFKNSNGEVTNSIPNYNDKESLRTLVRTAGRPEANTLLENTTISMEPPSVNEMSTSLSAASNATVNPSMAAPNIPKNIVADRLSDSTVAKLNNTLINSSNSLVRETARPMRGGFAGGLWSQLAVAAQELAPAAALFATGIALKNTRRRLRGRSRSRRRGQRK
jgi:thiol-disulfide isomerase/thioredoxin